MKLKYLAILGATALLSFSCTIRDNSNQPSTQTEASPPTTEPPSASAKPSPSSTQPVAQKPTQSGTFVGAEHPTQGSAQILTENGKNYLEFDENFKTDNGPDLVVILHRASDIKSISQPPAYSLKEGDYVILAALKQVSGTQRYAIPDNVNLTDYNSAAVWCRQFNATFGYASFKS
jgi:hypothetical protein